MGRIGKMTGATAICYSVRALDAEVLEWVVECPRCHYVAGWGGGEGDAVSPAPALCALILRARGRAGRCGR